MSNSKMKLFFKLILVALLLQTLLLNIALFITDDIESTLFQIAMIVDLFVFTAFAVYGAAHLTIEKDKRLGSLVIIAGSLIFIMGSLAWRGTFGFIPENPLSDILFERLIGDTPSETALDLTFITEIWEGLIISNFGILLMSVGLFLHAEKGRWFFLFYGIANIVFMISPLFVIIKVPASGFFLLIGVVSNLNE